MVIGTIQVIQRSHPKAPANETGRIAVALKLEAS